MMKTSKFDFRFLLVVAFVVGFQVLTMAFNILGSNRLIHLDAQAEWHSPATVIMSGVSPFCNRLIIEQLRKK